ncbi:MAG: helix-turn-helix domain-containing protein [Firmicutes bacterium]|nr:helix-turn-helix domain-containing protein [Bacillota bacterium]MCL2256003.1 helix-turn-helix domain-containing protein [Bacillota bacterium]
MFLYTFAKTLKELRLEKELTQEGLANILGVNRTSISDWEKPRTEPSLTMLVELAKFFGVTVDELLGVEN